MGVGDLRQLEYDGREKEREERTGISRLPWRGCANDARAMHRQTDAMYESMNIFPFFQAMSHAVRSLRDLTLMPAKKCLRAPRSTGSYARHLVNHLGSILPLGVRSMQ